MQPLSPWIEVRNLGSIEYADALALQRSLHAEVLEARENGQNRAFLLLLQHDPPVITVSRRPGAGGNVLVTDEILAQKGIERVETDRGGDVTYHGPGQLVAYPILDLNFLGLRIHGYIRMLEQAAIDTCGHFGVDAGRDACATGVWVGSGESGPSGGKIAALGVRVSRWITMHGLSLNVCPDMSHYQYIVPCGLHDRAVTSLARESGEAVPKFEDVMREFESRFRALADDPSAFRERR